MIKIKNQKILIKEIKQGKHNGILKGDNWQYFKIKDKHFLWYGKKIADISKRLKG